MISFHDVKSSWKYIVLTAISLQLIIIYLPSDEIYNEDADSAIRRAKTDSCKKELKGFARKISAEQSLSASLKRSCKLDHYKIRNQRIGCATNYTGGLVKLEQRVVNSSLCHDFCFSYGHSHGGYSKASRDCYCGDESLSSGDGLTNECLGQDEFDWYKVNNGIYYPLRHTRTAPRIETSDAGHIRIAFLLILNGRSDLHIRRLLKNIYSEKHIYYLHIDKRNSYLYKKLSSLKEEFNNVIVTDSRFNTIWGGPSLLRMILDALSHLSLYNWDYLVNLSESDFPIKPLSFLELYLSDNRPSIFLKTHNIKGYNFINNQGFDRHFYQCEDRVWRMGSRQLPRGIIYSGGSDWFALPRDFCMYTLENLSNSSSLVKPLVHLFNHTLLPAESFFHTLALNSEFCDRFADSNLRLTNWNRKQGCKCQHKDVVDWCGCSPLVYRSSDWHKLQQTNLSESLMFSRKFDPTISSSIIVAVEQQLIKQVSSDNESTEYDTRYWQSVFEKDFDGRDESHEVMQQFGLYCLEQIKKSLHEALRDQVELESIDIFFNKDRFVGWIYKYCKQSTCFELLVEKNADAHLHDYRKNCSNAINETSLKVIEVNHGFDTGERMFRVYKPMSHSSDILVYHEWFVYPQKRNKSNATSQLKFLWTNPEAQLEQVQSVKLKRVSKPTKLTLAHRLNIQKPSMSGLWSLTIFNRNTQCLIYKFLIFDQYSFHRQKISQLEFNKFFNVTKICYSTRASTDSLDRSIIDKNSCSKHDWSSYQIEK